MIKEKHTRLIARSIPNAQLVFIEGDHFIANKCPQAFNQAVLEFMGISPALQ
jgi:pimeloyl-ACP methyl ester carboxylesterase